MFEPKSIEELTKNERNNALNLITMAKEKRDGKIKGAILQVRLEYNDNKE